MRVKVAISCVLALLITACSTTSAVGFHTSTPPASPTSNPGCPTERPIFVWEQTQGQEPTAELLGDQNGQCESMLATIGSSGPAGVTYCIKIAYASDNPGYNQDIVPADPIVKPFRTFGSGCT